MKAGKKFSNFAGGSHLLYKVMISLRKRAINYIV